jgi:hypothetical protein
VEKAAAALIARSTWHRSARLVRFLCPAALAVRGLRAAYNFVEVVVEKRFGIDI